MGIKFAMNIIKEIEKRGPITVPSDYVTGEAYEEWLYEGIEIDSKAKNVTAKSNKSWRQNMDLPDKDEKGELEL